MSEEDRARAALHVLDWTGCAVAGLRSPAAVAMAVALSAGSLSRSDIFFLGAIGNVLEMDDVDKRALLHPGPVIVPAALVAARQENSNGQDFLNAVIRGYEAMIRIGRAVGPDHYRYWHNTATCGPFGAAAGASSIFNLDKEQLVWALGLAGTQASGFWQTRHEPASFAKQLHTARAAHAGLFSAHLAQSGFIGLKTILEGEQGFFAATCGAADPNMAVEFDEDAPWAIHDVSFKPWPACRHAHAAIDAALILRSAHPNWNEASSFLVRTYKDAIVFCDKPSPRDALSAKFSLQHAVAVALLRGKPELADFDEKNISASDVIALRNKIQVEIDHTFTARYPARFGASVRARFSDYDDALIEVPDALGDPENPASETVIISKAKKLMEAGGLANDLMTELCETALSLHIDHQAFEKYQELMFREVLS